jgi:hypothetical protein
MPLFDGYQKQVLFITLNWTTRKRMGRRRQHTYELRTKQDCSFNDDLSRVYILIWYTLSSEKYTGIPHYQVSGDGRDLMDSSRAGALSSAIAASTAGLARTVRIAPWRWVDSSAVVMASEACAWGACRGSAEPDVCSRFTIHRMIRWCPRYLAGATLVCVFRA